MLFPTNRFLFLLAVPLPALLGALFVPSARSVLLGEEAGVWQAVLWSYLSVLGLLLLDGLSIPRKKKFSATRNLLRVFSVGYPHKVELILDCTMLLRRRLRVHLHEDQLPDMEILHLPEALRLRKGRNRLYYQIRIDRRGLYEPKYVYLVCFSLLGLGRRVYRIPCPGAIHVYPDLKAVSKYALLARRSRLGLLGVRKLRKAGGDNDFERLKEYTRDDEFRHIDWKASARANTLIVRSYQKTQNQSVLFLVDCGRMMTSEYQGRSLLDHALSSMLLLSYVALKEKDRVGLLAFDSHVLRYVAPASGLGHHRRLIRACYDLEPRHRESNFELAFRFLYRVCRKRSLLCLLTNINDDMNARQLTSYLGNLAGRHLPFAVFLKQPEIETCLWSPPRDTPEMFVQASIADFAVWKEEALQRLRNQKVLTLDALPDELSTRLVNEYLRIKARNLL